MAVSMVGELRATTLVASQRFAQLQHQHSMWLHLNGLEPKLYEIISDTRKVLSVVLYDSQPTKILEPA